MVKLKKKVRYPRTSNLFDGFTALSFIAAGSALFYHWVPNSTWIKLSGDYSHSDRIGILENQNGLCSLKRRQSSTWEEVQTRTDLQRGDTLKTLEGTASLFIDPAFKVHVFEKTTLLLEDRLQLDTGIVQIQTQIHGDSQSRDRSNFVSFQIGTQWIRIEPKKASASFQVQVIHHDPPTLGVIAVAGPIQIYPSDSPEMIFLVPGQSVAFSQIESRLIQKNDLHLRAKKPVLGEIHSQHVHPFVPHILSPTSGARFFSNSNDKEKVTLTWDPLPESLKAEVEVRRLGDQSYRPAHEDTASGSLLNLTDGTYQWRVRSIDSEGKKSEWSSYQTFIVQESIRDSTPLSLDEESHDDSFNDNSSDSHSHAPSAAFSAPSPSPTRPTSAPRLHRPLKRSVSSLSQSKIKHGSQPHIASHTYANHSPIKKGMNSDPESKVKYQDIVSAAQQRIESFTLDRSKIQIDPQAQLLDFTGHQVQLFIRWSSPKNIDHYEIRLKKGNEELLPIETFDTHYRWALPQQDLNIGLSIQVNGFISKDEKLSGEWTPLKIVLLAPKTIRPTADLEQSASIPIDFSWHSPSDRVSFELQVSPSISFSKDVQTYSLQKAHTVVPLTLRGSYYWRVRSIFNHIQGEWTLPTRFYVR